MGIRWSLLSREALKSSVILRRAVARQWPLRKPDILYHFVLTLQSQTFGHAELQKRGYIIDDKGRKGERIHWILQSWSYHLKINFFKDINVTPERGCSRRQLVRHYYASSARRNNRVDPLKRIPCTIYKKPKKLERQPCPPATVSIYLSLCYLSPFHLSYVGQVACKNFTLMDRTVESEYNQLQYIPHAVFSLFLYN